MTPKIYISYSWQPEDLEIAETIDADWQAIGIQLFRDVRNVEYKDSLKDFMRSMQTGDYVLIIISDAYMQSKNCMFEALELFKNPDFKNKILPIITPNTDLFSAQGKLKFINYWDEKIESLNDSLKQVKGGLSNLHSILEELNHFTKVRNSIDEFSGIVSDMRGANWPKIKESNYDEIFKHINFSNTSILQECMNALLIDNEEEKELALDELEEKYPNNSIIFYTKGNLAFKEKKYLKARKYYEKNLKARPGLALWPLGQVEEATKNYINARQYYEQALNYEPLDALAHNSLGNIFRREDNSFESAKYHYEQAVKILPDRAEFHFNLADLILWSSGSNKHYEDAMFHYQRALLLNPKIEKAHLGLGIIYRNILKNYDLARFHYEAALKINPEYFKAHNSLGILLNDNIPEPSTAKIHLEKAITLRPEEPHPYSNLASIEMKYFNNYQSAKNLYQKALELHPNFTEARYNYACLLADYLDEKENARKQFEIILNNNPIKEAKYQYARLLANKFNEPKLLEEYFEQENLADPKTATEHHLLATVYGMIAPKSERDTALAIMHHRKSIELNSDYANNGLIDEILLTREND